MRVKIQPLLLFLIIIWFPFTGDIIPNVEGQIERATNRHSFKTRRLTGSTSTTGTNSNSESEEKMDLGSDPTHSSTTSSSTARSSSSHIFTIPESTNLRIYKYFLQFSFNLFVTSKNEFSSSPIHEFKVLTALTVGLIWTMLESTPKRAFKNPFLMVY